MADGRSQKPSPDLLCAWEPVDTLLREPNIIELIREQETELSGVPFPVELDIGRMREGERVGSYRVWAARQDGMLVGLVEWTLTRPFHHRNMLYAFDGGHFLAPEFRSPWLHLVIWRQAVEALRALGVKVVIAHDNPRRPMNVFFKRLGFDPAGQLYLRVL